MMRVSLRSTFLRAAEMALSRSSVSPIWPQALALWSCLSMEAPSTCRKKPFSDFGLACSRSSALSVKSARDAP